MRLDPEEYYMELADGSRKNNLVREIGDAEVIMRDEMTSKDNREMSPIFPLSTAQYFPCQSGNEGHYIINNVFNFY